MVKLQVPAAADGFVLHRTGRQDCTEYFVAGSSGRGGLDVNGQRFRPLQVVLRSQPARGTVGEVLALAIARRRALPALAGVTRNGLGLTSRSSSLSVLPARSRCSS